MDAAGIGGFFMHARGGLQTEYMSDEWFDDIAACIDEAKKQGERFPVRADFNIHNMYAIFAHWQKEYKTKAPAYEADILRTFASFVERGLVYRSKKPVYWSIPCATASTMRSAKYALRSADM